MDSYTIEREADSDSCTESDMVPISYASSEDGNSISRGGTEPKIKMRLRSFKLSRLPSLRSCMRPMKSPSSKCPSLFSADAASSEQSTPIAMPDASPNCTKDTSCSDPTKESFQRLERTLTRRSSFKTMKNLNRMSSMKLRRPSMRTSGGTEQKKKLKKTRSVKPTNFRSSRPSAREENDKHDQATVFLSSDVDTTTAARYSNAHFQASPRNSESSFSSNDQNRKNLKNARRPNSDSSVRDVERTTTLRPHRILTKTTSLKSKKYSMKKSLEVSEISESSIDRATCSSTLKDSKFPHHIKCQPGGSESEGISAMKVCTYSYCSLHGRRHGTVTPLKRFVSMRRRLLKTQKSMKPESHSAPKAKHSRNRRKEAQTIRVISSESSADKETTHICRVESSVIEEVFKAKLKGTHSQGEESINNGDSENLAEVMLDETLIHDPRFEPQKSRNPLTAKQQTQVVISAFQGTSEEGRCSTTEPDKVITQASATEKKEGEIVVSGTHNGDDKPILTVDDHRIIDSSLLLLKDSIQFDNRCLMLDDVVSTSHEEVKADAKVHKEVNGDTNAHLNLEVYEENSKSNIRVSQASTTTSIINEEKIEDSETDYGFLEELSPSGDSTPDCTTEQSPQTQIGKQKYMGLWGLIYQHVVSGITAEVETEVHHDGKDKEEHVKDKCAMTQMNDSVSCQRSTGTDEKMAMGDHATDNPKFELWQSDAIKQVKEAFDKILSEIPDQSFDDQSITSKTSEQEVLENNQCELGQKSISSYFDCTKESRVKDQEEAQLEAGNINTTEEGKDVSRVGNKSSQQISKNWSNLKKLIILKRFVKALEKVNKFNPRKPRYLPIEPYTEAEKVHLRHQAVEERKNADEWMLDYALRQVISNLAPAQKRKVALLVQAFETVTPTEINTRLMSNATASPHTTLVQECTDSIIQMGEQNNSRLLHQALCPEMSLEKTEDQVSNFSAAERQLPGTCSVFQERNLGCGCGDTTMGLLTSETAQKKLKEEDCILTVDQRGFNDVSSANPKESRLFDKPSKRDDGKNTFHEECHVNEKIILEVHKEVPLMYGSKLSDRDIKFNGDKFETGNLHLEAGEQSCQHKSLILEKYTASTAVSSAVSSASFPELLEDPRAACGEEANTKYEVLQKSSPLEKSEPCDTFDMAQESKLEKPKYTRLWYLIYKHMVSSSAEDGPQPLLEGEHKGEQRSNANTLLGTKDANCNKDFSEMNRHSVMDNQNTSSQKIDYHQIEAIKIIEEAIDEIPLPDVQDDSPHDPSITSNMHREQKLQKKHGKDGELFNSTSNDSAKDCFKESNNTKVENDTTLDPSKIGLNPNNISVPEESVVFSKSENKSKPQMRKSWSSLKKVILLKRFIESLERVKKLNSRKPQYLPLEPDTEAEKVHLRHQDTEDRKKAEEWMLDHALRQVVAKLTPDRKRKVELLVEAFETVTPMSEVKSSSKTQCSSFFT